MQLFSYPIFKTYVLGATKEPSQWDGSFENQQPMFWLRNKIFTIYTKKLFGFFFTPSYLEACSSLTFWTLCNYHPSCCNIILLLKSWNIRIYHEKPVPRIIVWHHEACRVMTNGDPRDWFFYPTLTQIMDYFSGSPVFYFKKGFQTSLNILRCNFTW